MASCSSPNGRTYSTYIPVSCNCRDLWELVSDQDFRALLAALNFEARYEATKRELTIKGDVGSEWTHPDGPRAPLLFVPPAGHKTHLYSPPWRLSTKSW
jgi:hypothetical protein